MGEAVGFFMILKLKVLFLVPFDGLNAGLVDYFRRGMLFWLAMLPIAQY